ncbi:hypothetical protein EGW08_010392 [Elysia chlorotica]|uniref:Reelin domain-containing protein n=1 Tax=Elysia chlorotica TaxID=188477 RepID=A0A3S1C3F0_ELYCH|nr:hypothetical protein EGW08_010392 [Elysia chlorotica]
MKTVDSPAFRGFSFIVATFAVCFIQDVSAYSLGAPYSTCFTRYPKHSHTPAQRGENPYAIRLSRPQYLPGETIKVEISSSDPGENPIKGFQIAAFVDNTNDCEPMTIVGQFSDVDESKSTIFSCLGTANSVRNMVTHKNNGIVNLVSFSWTAPSPSVGNIKFM